MDVGHDDEESGTEGNLQVNLKKILHTDVCHHTPLADATPFQKHYQRTILSFDIKRILFCEKFVYCVCISGDISLKKADERQLEQNEFPPAKKAVLKFIRV